MTPIRIARQDHRPRGDAMDAIAQTFGRECLDDTGALDRAHAPTGYSTQAKSALEAIVHPLVSLHSSQQAQAAEASGARIIVFDVPLLVESGRWAQRLDAIVVVDCPEPADTACDGAKRAGARHGGVVLAAQAPRQFWRASADIVIDNGDNCALADLQQLATETAALFGL